ncbi:MAG TPA: S9 family peptidase [Thermoanaerobaculia bacterium]|nr:S9 family peptidase [Thermoanaerobaculia bacterium]
MDSPSRVRPALAPLGAIVALGIALPAALPASPSRAADDLRTAVTRLASIGGCWSPSFSPDGKTIAFVSDLSGVPQVWTVPSGGGWPVQVTALEDTVSAVDWSPSGEWLAVAAAPGGGMNQQAYLVSPDGVTVRRITPGGAETNWLGAWSGDGAWLGLSSNRAGPASMNGYLYETAADATVQVVENQGIGTFADLDREGRRALLSRVAGRGSNDLFLIPLRPEGDVPSRSEGDDLRPQHGEERAEILLTPHEGPGSFAGRFGRDATTVYLLSDDGRDLTAFGRVRVADGAPSAFELLRERADAELESFAISPNEDRAALVWNVAGRSELEMLDLRSGESSTVDLSVDLIGGLEFARNGRLLALVGRGATSPSNVYVLNLATGLGRQITDAPHPGVELATLVRPELVRYPSHDGLELSGWLYRPPGVAEPAPYVLSFHGGPEGQERPSLRSDYQALISQGIGVFAPNIRGSSGFGKRFVNLDNRELRFDANRDIAASAKWLAAQGIADRARLGIMGGSYGGYAVMVAVTEFPDLFAAGVNLFGMVNFETFFAHTEPWMAAISGTEYGDPETEVELLRRLSPIHKLDEVETPLLVQHGANDTNVPVVEAEQVVENLERRGVPVEYVLFEDEGHGFRKAKNRITSTVATVEWFVERLKRRHAGG